MLASIDGPHGSEITVARCAAAKHLAQADRHIAKLKRDIARQWQIIEELTICGQPLHEAISMLRLLKDHLRIMERYRQSTLDKLEKTK